MKDKISMMTFFDRVHRDLAAELAKVLTAEIVRGRVRLSMRGGNSPGNGLCLWVDIPEIEGLKVYLDLNDLGADTSDDPDQRADLAHEIELIAARIDSGWISQDGIGPAAALRALVKR